jgi:hypothetical protein
MMRYVSVLAFYGSAAFNKHLCNAIFLWRGYDWIRQIWWNAQITNQLLKLWYNNKLNVQAVILKHGELMLPTKSASVATRFINKCETHVTCAGSGSPPPSLKTSYSLSWYSASIRTSCSQTVYHCTVSSWGVRNSETETVIIIKLIRYLKSATVHDPKPAPSTSQPRNLSMMHLNVIFQLHSRSYKWIFSKTYPHQNVVCTSCLSRSAHMSKPPQFLTDHNSNNNTATSSSTSRSFSMCDTLNRPLT